MRLCRRIDSMEASFITRIRKAQHRRCLYEGAGLISPRKGTRIRHVSEIKAREMMEPPKKVEYCILPLVYSCPGCSSPAQLTNSLAIRLDREQLAEMSCIAGVGGDVRSLGKTALSGRKIVVMNECPLHCAKHCLNQYGVSINAHLDLSMAGVKKNFHQDATPEDAQHVWKCAVLPVIARLN